MSLGVTNWPLLFEIMLDYITIFCFEVSPLNTLSVREMFSLGMVSTKLFMLFYVGGIQNPNCRRLEMARYFFLQVGEICKSRQRCSSTVPLPVTHRHQRMWRLGFTLIIVGK